MSFTRLVRKSQVDKKTAKNRYAIHLFSDKSSQHEKVVTEEYIPYFQSQLQNAVSQGDSIKIQVYIRALGNIAHRKILAVFEPYLEGEQPMSNFQRLTIIAALNELTWVHPNTARRVLYRLYQNTADTPEVRVAAVMQILRTNPPAQMLQRMAEFTNIDHCDQVNAAVKSGIESAANNNDANADSSELRNNARSAVNLLTTKEHGVQYSKNFIHSYVLKEMSAQYKQELSLIQGKDSIYPNSVLYNLHKRVGGFNRHSDTLQYMTSSVEDIMRLFNKLTSSDRRDQNSGSSDNVSSQHTYEGIAEAMNLTTEEQEQIEGQFMLKLLGGERFYSFDNHTIEQLPKILEELQRAYSKGAKIQKSKFYNKYSLEVGFPVVMGVPFFYSFEEPTFVAVRGKVKGVVEEEKSQHGYNIPSKAGIAGEVEMTYASQSRGKVGFVTPFDNQRYVAGYNRKLHIHAPIQGKLELNDNNTVQASLRPFSQNGQRQELLVANTTAYTTWQGIQDLRPYSQVENTRIISRQQAINYQGTIGRKETGFAFDVKVQSERRLSELLNKFQNKQNDWLSMLMYNDIDSTISNDYLSISFNPEESSEQPVRITLSYLSNDPQWEGSSRMTMMKSRLNTPTGNLAQPTSYENRQRELYNNVKKGINSATAHLIDLAVELGEEENRSGYSLTIAHADSPVSELARILVYSQARSLQSSQKNKPTESAMEVSIKSPQIPVTNFRDAINANPSSRVEGKINMKSESNGNSQIKFQVQMERSQARKEYVEEHPSSKGCMKQMEEGNHILSLCRNATVQAHYLDSYNIKLNYNNVPIGIQKAVYKAYSWARQAGYKHVKENIIELQNPHCVMEIGVQFSQDLRTANVSIEAPHLSSRFVDVKVPQLTVPSLVHNPSSNQISSDSQALSPMQPLVNAVIDGNKATTFDNKTYPIDLGDCYHVFAMYAPHSQQPEQTNINMNRQEKFAVLVKQSGSQKKEVRVVLGSDNIDLSSSGASRLNLQANGERIQLSEKEVKNWRSSQNNMQAYIVPRNGIVLNFPYNGLQLIYAGARVQLTISDSYRNRIRGLAGTFNGDRSEDFSMPNNRVIERPLEFASMYALTNESSCNGPARERQEQARRAPSYVKTVIFGDVITKNDTESGSNKTQTNRKSNSIKHSGSIANKPVSCLRYQVMILEQPGKTCFSLRPQVACKSHCKSSNNFTKNIEFHCMETSSASRHWMQVVKKGGQPNFTQANHWGDVSLPETCVRN